MNTRTRILKIAGSSLLALAIAVAFLWFYWLAPFRHLNSPAWCESNSAQRRWIEEQKQLSRTGPDHDSSIELGHYGDKNWAEWTIQELEKKASPEPLHSCGTWPYHLPEALPEMTNQRLTNGTWRTWWEANKNKTQTDWIREGFAQHGIVLQGPLTTNQIVVLLKLSVSTNAGGYLQDNARRWLRDSEFRSKEFNLEAVAEEDRNEIIRGLVNYSFWHGFHYNDPGEIYPAGYHTKFRFEDPFIETRRFKVGLFALIIALTCAGLLMLRRAARARRL